MKYNSKLSTYQLKKIIRHFCADIEASKTALLIGFNRNTVNRRYGIFRYEIHLYQTGLKELLYGSIEVDESYFSAKRRRGFHGKLKRGGGTLKQPVFGIFERNDRVYAEIVPDCKKQTLQSVILGKVALEMRNLLGRLARIRRFG